MLHEDLFVKSTFAHRFNNLADRPKQQRQTLIFQYILVIKIFINVE
jgi:hypothetical protein